MILDNTHLEKEIKKKTGSIYTPLYIVEKMMSKVPDEIWSDQTKTFCDPTCGVGNIIIPMLDNRVKHGVEPTVALKTMYGNELLKESYDILMTNLQEWADKHGVTDKSWKENFYNMDFFEFIKLAQRPSELEGFFDENFYCIDCFIMNPPYTGPNLRQLGFKGTRGTDYGFSTKIYNKVKEANPLYMIGISPMSQKTRYKTAEWVDACFGEVGWRNIFIFDLNGENNEYFLDKIEIPFIEKSNYYLTASMNVPLYVKYHPPGETFCGSKKSVDITNKELFDFIEAVNTSKLGNFYREALVTTSIQGGIINKLYQLYKEGKLIYDSAKAEKYEDWKTWTKCKRVLYKESKSEL